MKILIPLLCLPLLFLAATACAGAGQANRVVEDYVNARQDGNLNASEIAVLDRDITDLADSVIPLPPLTGTPWVDTLLQVAGVAVGAAGTGLATHKYTMNVRDKLAAAKQPPTDPAA